MRSALAPPGAGPSGADRETGILAERVSKRYPGRRVLIFPPVLSIFERDLSLFGRRRPSADAEPDTHKRPDAGAGYDVDDEDDEDDDERDRELEDDLPPARARPDEMFWALRDVSLRVAPGAALGVLGGPGAGKSTLLRILSGRAVPTEGRVLVRGRVAPVPAELQKALAVSGKQGDDLVLACRLLGVDPQLVKQHRDEIEEFAQPLLTPDGDPVRGARMRFAIATTVVLPASVILIEEPRALDEAFTERVFERLHERLRTGSSLILASRNREFVQRLCDEVIVLREGEIVDRGDAKETVGRHEPAPKVARARVRSAVPAFNASAALLFAEVLTATGVRSKRLDADDELLVEIRLETAAPDTEVRCGVSFTPRSGGTALRLELPERVRLADPRTYVLVARILPGTLPSGGYEVRADATVGNGAEGEASVIARDIGRLRIVGDESRAAGRVEAEWSIE